MRSFINSTVFSHTHLTEEQNLTLLVSVDIVVSKRYNMYIRRLSMFVLFFIIAVCVVRIIAFIVTSIISYRASSKSEIIILKEKTNENV